MTRDEAIKRRDGGENCFNLINDIFDDFESQTCENCKLFKEIDQDGSISCLNFHYIKTGYDFVDDDDFGCNKWEKKDD